MLEDVDLLGNRQGFAHLAEHVVLWLTIIGDMSDYHTPNSSLFAPSPVVNDIFPSGGS